MILDDADTQPDVATDFDDDAALMAGLDALDAAADGDNPEPAEHEGEEVSESDESQETGESAEEETEETPEEPAEAKEDDKADDKVAQRLETLQKAEERSKLQIDEYRQQAEDMIAKREAELAPKLELAQRFEQLSEQVRYDAGGVLMALGLKPEDMEASARLLWSMRPEALNDPKTRDAAQRAMQGRRQTDALSEMRAELKALKDASTQRDEQETQRQAQAKHDQEIGTFMQNVVDSVGDSAPLVASLLRTNPKKANALLRRHADELANEYREVPSASDVVARFEKERRADLKELGIDPDTVAKTAMKTKTKGAGEKQTAKTLTNNLGTPKRPRVEPKTEEELDAEIAAGLDELDAIS